MTILDQLAGYARVRTERAKKSYRRKKSGGRLSAFPKGILLLNTH